MGEREVEGWFLEDMHGKGALRRPKEGGILHSPKHPFTPEKARRFRQLRETGDLETVSLLTSIIPLRDPPIEINAHYLERVPLPSFFRRYEERKQKQLEVQHEEDYFLNYEPVPGAKEGLRQINRLGCRTTIATGTPECCAKVFQKMIIDDELDDIVDQEVPMMMTRVPKRIAHGLWPGIVTTTDTKLLDALHIQLGYGISPTQLYLGDDSPYVAWLFNIMLGGKAYLYEEEGEDIPTLFFPKPYDLAPVKDYGVKGGQVIPVIGKGIMGAAEELKKIR